MSNVAPSADVDRKMQARRASRYASYVFLIMFIISFLNYLDRNILTGAATVVALDLNFNLDGIGVIASAFLIVYTLGTVPLGIWADRAKRKDVVAICVAVWSLATAFTALARNFTTLFLSRMVLGIGEAGYFPAGTALMSDYFSRAKRSRIMSWWSVGQLIGILIGFGIGGALTQGTWRLAFVFTGIPGLILAFLAWKLREPRRNEADEEAMALEPRALGNEIEVAPHAIAVSSNIFSQFGTLLRIKTLMVLIVMQIFAYFVLGVNLVFLPTYLHQNDTFQLTTAQAGIFLGLVIVLAGGNGCISGGFNAGLAHRRP